MPTLVPPRAFISYRTEDSQAVATTLERELKRIPAWGEVFLDHRSLDAGESWPKRLRAEVQRADVVLLLIGPRWLTLQAPDGIRKLDDPDDWDPWDARWNRIRVAPLTDPEARELVAAVGGDDLTSADTKDVENVIQFARGLPVPDTRRCAHGDWPLRGGAPVA
jgi:hypothetical protein